MKQPTPCRTADYRYLIPMILMGIIGFLFAYCSNWFADAIEYKYIHPAGDYEFQSDTVGSLADIWESQCNHYFGTNGRFVVHFIVQIFCGLAGKVWFALFNGLIWFLLPYLAVRFATRGAKSLSVSVSACALILLMLLQVRIDPPFQINYAWTAAAIVGWLMIFFSGRRYSPWMLILIGIYSFLCGECNESFSIPICFAMAAYALRRRLRLTLTQWVAAVTFGIAAIILVAAPGNWLRLGEVSYATRHTLGTYYFFIPALFVPALCACVAWTRRHSDKIAFTPEVLFLVVLVAVNYSLGTVTGYQWGARMVFMANLCIVMATLALVAKKHLSVVANAVLVLLALVSVALHAVDTKKFNDTDNRIYEAYASSADGVVYLPDTVFSEHIWWVRNAHQGHVLESRLRSPGLPDIKIRPEALRNIPADADTNVIVEVAPQAWLMVQSKKHPARFILHKKILPGTVARHMADREIDFSIPRDVVFEENDMQWIGFYRNIWPLTATEMEMTENRP